MIQARFGRAPTVGVTAGDQLRVNPLRFHNKVPTANQSGSEADNATVGHIKQRDMGRLIIHRETAGNTILLGKVIFVITAFIKENIEPIYASTILLT